MAEATKRRRPYRRADMTPEEIASVEAIIARNVAVLKSLGMQLSTWAQVEYEKTPLNPSYAATLRVTNPRDIPTKCDCCGSTHVACSHHDHVYGIAYGTWPWLMRCLDCDARVGLHPFTNIPLGTMAGAELRQARMEAKQALKRKAIISQFSTNEAYDWLARKLRIPLAECQFGWFNFDQCARVVEVAQPKPKIKRVLS